MALGDRLNEFSAARLVCARRPAPGMRECLLSKFRRAFVEDTEMSASSAAKTNTEPKIHFPSLTNSLTNNNLPVIENIADEVFKGLVNDSHPDSPDSQIVGNVTRFWWK